VDDFVFPCEELAYAIRSLIRAFGDIDYFGEDDGLYERLHAAERHNGQVYGMIGASTADWRGLKVPRRVNDAAHVVWASEGRTLFFGADCWRGAVFRAAVRANADPEWADGFAATVEAAKALGGQKAVLGFLLTEFPPLETPEDRRRRYEEERERQEYLLFWGSTAQGGGA
jgi:hypothetical protein